MSLHQSIDYKFDFENEQKAEEAFERFVSETNADKNAVLYDYILTEEDGNIYVNEIGEMQGRVNGRRTLITEEYLIEGVLEQEEVEKVKERYEELV
jgi:hypothetical protein